MSTAPDPHLPNKVASVVGLGVIGASVALALRAQGFNVSGVDLDTSLQTEALNKSVIDQIGIDPGSSITILAVPVDAIPGAAENALDATNGWVTDTGSVKSAIADAVSDPRFIPGHPMAGSEQTGFDGASKDLFSGAVWVLCPTTDASDEGFAFVHDLVAAFGADPITLTPTEHDSMVATVSHVPHLTAGSLMNVADRRATQHRAMLRLAAGGFRDMTRISSGTPEIWPSICQQNKQAILETLDDVIAELNTVRSTIEVEDADAILNHLSQARSARQSLPTSRELPAELAEVRVRIKDEKGQLAALTALAATNDVNIYDVEIAHSAEGPTGVLVLVVSAGASERLLDAFQSAGYTVSVRYLQ